MRSKIIPATFALVLFLSMAWTAQAQKVKYFTEAGVDMTQYRTYKWKRADDARYPEDSIDAILTKATDEQLAAKGWVKTDSDEADAYVIYQLAVVDDMAWSSFKSGGDFQGGYQNNPGFEGRATNTSEVIRKGMLIIDIYDVKRKKQVWQAVATKTVGDGKDLVKAEKNTRKAMAKIFRTFPSRAK